MAIVIQDTNLIDTRLILADGDDVFVTEGTIIAHSTSNVIEGGISDMTFFNAGTITGESDAILIFNTGGDANLFYQFQNQSTGTIHGESSAVFFQGAITNTGFDEVLTFINHGTVTAGRYGALISNKIDTVSVVNTGTLLSSALGGGYPIEGAVGIQDATQGIVNNSGNIITNSIAGGISASNASRSAALIIEDAVAGSDFVVTNSGLIQGATHSFYSDADTLSFSNSGEMIGTAYIIAVDARLTNTGVMDGGMIIDGTDARLVNNGTMSGDIDFINDTADFINSGTVSGDVSSGSGADMILNRGYVSGDVSLGAGADTFKGRGGTVEGTVFGEGGDDFLAGGSEADILDGGDDDDELYGRDGNDTLEGGAGNDDLFGNDGDDVLTGGDGIDILNGGRGDDNMNGDADNDKLFGRDGVDNLNGGTGDDFIDGGNGDDRLVGGGGNDRLEGGDGIDTAVFTGAEADYTIQVLSNGALRVIDDRAGTPNGTDIITNVEFLNFTDGIVDVAGL